MVAENRRARAAFGFWRVRFINSFTQNFRHKFRHGNERIALAEHEMTARPRRRTFCHVSRQNDFWTNAGQFCRKYRRPDVTSVMAVNNLNSFAPDQFCRAQNESDFIFRGWMERNAEIADN